MLPPSSRHSRPDPPVARIAPYGEEPIAGLILAGGLSRRMAPALSEDTPTQSHRSCHDTRPEKKHHDKAWKRLKGRFLIEHVIARATPQVDTLLINAPKDSPLYERLDLPIIPDSLSGHLGPLAGILSGLEWASQQVPAYRWLASFAVDTPFFPPHLVQSLTSAIADNQADIACAVAGKRRHPVFALWSVALAQDLRVSLQQGVRKIEDWTGRHLVAFQEFPLHPVDPFFNVNHPEDLAKAEILMTEYP